MAPWEHDLNSCDWGGKDEGARGVQHRLGSDPNCHRHSPEILFRFLPKITIAAHHPHEEPVHQTGPPGRRFQIACAPWISIATGDHAAQSQPGSSFPKRLLSGEQFEHHINAIEFG